MWRDIYLEHFDKISSRMDQSQFSWDCDMALYVQEWCHCKTDMHTEKLSLLKCGEIYLTVCLLGHHISVEI